MQESREIHDDRSREVVMGPRRVVEGQLGEWEREAGDGDPESEARLSKPETQQQSNNDNCNNYNQGEQQLQHEHATKWRSSRRTVGRVGGGSVMHIRQ